jgi:hypothetical protein
VSTTNGDQPVTHYDTLGIAPSASSDQVRKAYLAKARLLHPDQFADRPVAERARAERLMKELNVAWTVLNDPMARRAYDHDLRVSAESRQALRPTVRTTGPVTGARAAPRPRVVSERPSAAEARRPPQVATEADMELGRLGRLVRSGPLIVLGAVFLLIVIIVALVNSGGDGTPAGRPEPTDASVPLVDGATPVACLELAPRAIEVECGQHTAVAWAVIADGEQCPASPPGLVPYYREGLGGLWCVVEP